VSSGCQCQPGVFVAGRTAYWVGSGRPLGGCDRRGSLGFQCRRGGRCRRQLPIAGEPRGAGVAFIISELPGGRAEALWFAMAALVPTAGAQCRQSRPYDGQGLAS
jgi:hypothetical protein